MRVLSDDDFPIIVELKNFDIVSAELGGPWCVNADSRGACTIAVASIARTGFWVDFFDDVFPAVVTYERTIGGLIEEDRNSAEPSTAELRHIPARHFPPLTEMNFEPEFVVAQVRPSLVELADACAREWIGLRQAVEVMELAQLAGEELTEEECVFAALRRWDEPATQKALHGAKESEGERSGYTRIWFYLGLEQLIERGAGLPEQSSFVNRFFESTALSTLDGRSSPCDAGGR